MTQMNLARISAYKRKPWVLALAGLIILVAAYVLVIFLLYTPANTTPFTTASEVYDVNNSLILKLYQGAPARQQDLDIAEVPQDCINALVATEDRNFYSHIGVDAKGLVRGAIDILTGTNRGGSTITQQLVKVIDNDFYSALPNRINNTVRAVKLNGMLGKDQQLEVYFNTTYFGNYNYGLATAAQEYFGITAADLDLAECSYLVGVVNKPSIFNPTADLNAGLLRQKVVLDSMKEAGLINQDQYQQALAETLQFQIQPVNFDIATFAPALMQKLKDQNLQVEIETDKLIIHTSFDFSQQATEWSILDIK